MSKTKVEILAYNGWGMTASFWDKWDSLLGNHVHFKKNDRGYFHSPVNQHFSEPDSVKILFVQGFGIHLVSQRDWQMAHHIVLFSTFKHLKDIVAIGRNSEHVILTLKNQLESRADFTLDLFWEKILRGDEKFKNLKYLEIRDKKLLMDDLEVYHGNIVVKPSIRDTAKVILLETENDELTVYPQDKVMKELFGRLDHYERFDFVGHGFPFLHAEECHEYLKERIEVLN